MNCAFPVAVGLCEMNVNVEIGHEINLIVWAGTNTGSSVSGSMKIQCRPPLSSSLSRAPFPLSSGFLFFYLPLSPFGVCILFLVLFCCGTPGQTPPTRPRFFFAPVAFCKETGIFHGRATIPQWSKFCSARTSPLWMVAVCVMSFPGRGRAAQTTPHDRFQESDTADRSTCVRVFVTLWFHPNASLAEVGGSSEGMG